MGYNTEPGTDSWADSIAWHASAHNTRKVHLRGNGGWSVQKTVWIRVELETLEKLSGRE